MNSLLGMLPPALLEDCTRAERRLLAAVAEGEPIDLSSGDPQQDDPAAHESWGPDRTIRAKLLYWLCTSPKVVARVHRKGIQILGAKIEGRLDLEGVTLSRPLHLTRSAILDGISLSGAITRTISLIGSRTGPLSAEGMTVRGSVLLAHAHVNGQVRLSGSRVEGRLVCSGATIENPEDCALLADVIRVAGDVCLDSGFRSIGEVRLRGASIEGNLTCSGGTFEGKHSGALNAHGVTVKGNVLLDQGFHATGEVCVPGAIIGGLLICRGGRFNNPNGNALTADGITVQGNVLLDRSFHAVGAVRIVGAQIGGQLGCTRGKFEKPDDVALNASRTVTQGSVFLADGFEAVGEVRLLRADIGGLLTCSGGSFRNPGGDALNAEGITVERNALLDHGFHAMGRVSLQGAKIGGLLRCVEAQFEDPECGAALIAERMSVDGGLFLQRVHFDGLLTLQDARVGTLVDSKDGWPERGKLYLAGFQYKSLGGDQTPTNSADRLDWLRRQPRKPFRPQPYEQLASVLRQMGQESDAVDILIAKQHDLIHHGELSWFSRSVGWMLGLALGHGYRPWRVIPGILFFVIVGWLIFRWAAANGVMVPSAPAVLTSKAYAHAHVLPRDYPVLQPAIYSLDAFLPLIDLHQETYWLPNAAHPRGWMIQVYLWVHIFFGWLLSTLFVAGITGLVRKG